MRMGGRFTRKPGEIRDIHNMIGAAVCQSRVDLRHRDEILNDIPSEAKGRTAGDLSQMKIGDRPRCPATRYPYRVARWA